MTVPSSPIFTDLYELTMMYVWFQTGRINDEACFDLFFRTAPFNGQYIVAAGIDDALRFLSVARFSADDIRYIQSLGLFSEEFLTWLAAWRFDGSVYAVLEGTVVFPNEPVLRVSGPLGSCQLVETALLNCINFPSLVATKASRICMIAGWDSVLEFGARRAQGPDGALSASRYAYLGGCVATSNLEAGKMYGIPVKGTHAHSYVMSFPSELDAFREYAQVFPDAALLLIDTYDSLKSGLLNAITVGKEMEEEGSHLSGVRLDSGNLASLSRKVREELDSAGLSYVRIVASGDLDEYSILDLKKKGAPVDIYGVGTRLVTGHDSPALSGVYKLAAIRGPDGVFDMRLKITDGSEKVSLPGIKQVWRSCDTSGRIVCDVIDLATSRPLDPDACPLLVSGFCDGNITRPIRTIATVRDDVRKTLMLVPRGVTRLESPEIFPVRIGDGLVDIRDALIRQYSR